MANVFLQDIVDSINYDSLPYNWTSFDIENFSKSKKLWYFQKSAVENAVIALWKYYEDFVDYQNGERPNANLERKRKLFKLYKDNGLQEDLDIDLDKRKRRIFDLLVEYYPQDDKHISYESFINRMCFWMATGSGKTIVLIKLIQVLKQLMQRGEIPEHDILFLTHRDDLLEQFKKAINEFNYANPNKIELRELKEYPEIKRQRSLLGSPVFYYKSDNINDEQKVKTIDFKNYDNDGKWYIFLDEAHKGDKEDSKRQHIYSILSRNGFLFNFSATFIDIRDIITSAFEFNLSSFIRAGYGKHINLLKQEIRAFREDEDYSTEEKQKIVLKSLIIITYIKRFYKELLDIERKVYHNPMLLVLVNSVNKEDADLKLFFNELERIGKGNITEKAFKESLDELWNELKDKPEFLFESGKNIEINEIIFRGITIKDILKDVCNSDSFGDFEISFRPSDKSQVAYKLTTSDKHFALSKTGDMPKWLKDELNRFNVNHQFEDDGYFERINQDDSTINILMGSRAFYEGWDSNRPNLINFVNIGTEKEAKKFILQSVGRGVRIEPITHKRRRLAELHNNNEVDDILFGKISELALPMETLFIFGTNRNALDIVINELEQKKEKTRQLSLFVNIDAEKHTLLIPVYRSATEPLVKKEGLAKFSITPDDLGLLKRYTDYISDDRIFLFTGNTTPEKIKILRDTLQNDRDYYKEGDKEFRNVDVLVQRAFDYFGIIPEETDGLHKLTDEIKHFENIMVNLDVYDEIKEKVEIMKDYPEKAKELDDLYGKISRNEFSEKEKILRESSELEYNHQKIRFKHLANHYYIPLILSDKEKADYIIHIIKTTSEKNFINELEKYMDQGNNRFKDFDWWMFSKLDETLDKVYIPYYSPDTNKISKFYPDFIFWLKKGNDYFIVFIDPKGIKYTDYEHKVCGYKTLFEEANGELRKFKSNGVIGSVSMFLYTEDANRIPNHEYRKYWSDNIDKVLISIFASR